MRHLRTVMSARIEEQHLELATNIARQQRSDDVRFALLLTYITLGWMTIEGAVAVGAGIVAGSLLLVAFGIDSAIELASAVVVFRRCRFEFTEKSESAQHSIGDVERRAAHFTGYLLLLLSAYVLLQATFGLMTRHAAETSPIGIAVAIIAAFGMPFLAKAKLRVAARIDSRSLRADAMETLTCGYLAWVLLAGLALNAVTHWWWIDSVASLAIVPLLLREGYEAISDRDCSVCS
jgi:divalent metal cation (Fe/Co/Zn/Cd) transporter